MLLKNRKKIENQILMAIENNRIIKISYTNKNINYNNKTEMAMMIKKIWIKQIRCEELDKNF